MRNTDWYLDELYDFLPSLGITTVQAAFSRYVIDPNRSLKKPLFGHYRKAAVYESNTWEEPLYKNGHPSKSDIRNRVAAFYRPYHNRLQEELSKLTEDFGRAWLVDLHSFAGSLEEDVCLGNAHGNASTPETMTRLHHAFSKNGFTVVQNKVYPGGHIVRRYGTFPNVEAVQIELNYTRYLQADQIDEPRRPPRDRTRFPETRKALYGVFQTLECFFAGDKPALAR